MNEEDQIINSCKDNRCLSEVESLVYFHGNSTEQDYHENNEQEIVIPPA
jgi:hypothetical protein